MKKVSFLFILAIITLFGCNNENEVMYETNYYSRYTIEVDSNLPKFRIDNTTLDSSKAYPYMLYDVTEKGTENTAVFTVYPVSDSGYIRLKLYGGIRMGYPEVGFLKSLRLATPIDTTFVRMQLNNDGGSLTVVKNPG